MVAATAPDNDEQLKQRIQNGYMIESVAEMTQGYEEALKAPLLVNADIEMMSAPLLIDQAMKAPSMDARNAELSTLQDELGHGYISLRLLDNLGEDPHELIHDRPPEKWRSGYVFETKMDDFADQTIFHAFGDQAGLNLLSDIHKETSYAPWKRALVKVEKEEQFHIRHGRTWFRRLANKTEDTKRRLQEAAEWQFPLWLEIFGLPDDLKTHTEQLEYRIKGKTNDELRQDWLGEIVPMCEDNDIDVPAHYDEGEDEYVLDFDWPVKCDPEEKTWHYDEPVTWDDVLDRWRAGGPKRDEFVQRIRSNVPLPNDY